MDETQFGEILRALHMISESLDDASEAIRAQTILLESMTTRRRYPGSPNEELRVLVVEDYDA